MIIALDIETQGLDATKFVCGYMITETGREKLYFKKEKLWEDILKLGKAARANNHVLSVYAHNAEFDFYGYADLTDRNLTFYSFDPFIAGYMIDGKEAIKFLDTMAIYGMSLERAGELIGVSKMEMPEELKTEHKWNHDEIRQKIQPYVRNDTQIVMDLIGVIKKRLKGEHVILKRLYTISQISVNYLMKELREMKGMEDLFEQKNKERLICPKNKDYAVMIHSAYRGGEE